MTAVRYLAIHLPQFHPIPENDEWWGPGFTEWTNVTRATPRFPGHYQPQLPADLGFYDLRLPEARAAQAALAQRFGIDGFCYYHYWFHGRRMLERPVDEILSSGEPALPFCLCWANESWSRRWDGGDHKLLIEQRYSAEDNEAHIRHLLRYFLDPRYIRIDGKPLFLVYRAQDIPELPELVALWQQRAREAGLPGLFLLSVRNGWNPELDPRTLGLDASLKFQPFFPIADRMQLAQSPTRSLVKHGIDGLRHVAKLVGEPARKGLERALHHAKQRAPQRDRIFSYSDFVAASMREPPADFPELSSVCPGWDNSPRRAAGAFILTDSDPHVFGDWLRHETAQVQRLPAAQRIVFINAWNEWAEGNHLEPDQRFGTQFLDEVRRCKAELAADRRSA